MVFANKFHKGVFYFFAVMLSLYISYIGYLAHSKIFISLLDTLISLVVFICIASVTYFLLIKFCKQFAKRTTLATLSKKTFSNLFFWSSFGISFALLGIALFAHYPGSISYDAYNQWMQASTGLYNNWHPVFHTWLISLIIRFVPSYAVVILIQIICFSLSLAVLLSTLYRYNISAKLLLVLQIFMVLSPATSNQLLYLWKDNAMTCGMLLLFSFATDIYFTKGAWLKKYCNACLLGIVLTYLVYIRHNAILASGMFFVWIVICFWNYRKGLFITLFTALLTAFLIQGVLFSQLDIIYPDNKYEESVGLPMILLANQKQQDDSKLSVDANKFLATLATDQQWQNTYKKNDYNSIKFTYFREYIKHTEPMLIWKLALETANANPRLAFETFNDVTDLVWGIDGENVSIEDLSARSYLGIKPPTDIKFAQLARKIQSIFYIFYNLPPVKYLTLNFGVHLLLLFIVTLLALYKKGIRALIFAMPLLAYHFATMLLLCGNDARFFGFTMVVSLPACLVLLKN